MLVRGFSLQATGNRRVRIDTYCLSDLHSYTLRCSSHPPRFAQRNCRQDVRICQSVFPSPWSSPPRFWVQSSNAARPRAQDRLGKDYSKTK